MAFYHRFLSGIPLSLEMLSFRPQMYVPDAVPQAFRPSDKMRKILPVPGRVFSLNVQKIPNGVSAPSGIWILFALLLGKQQPKPVNKAIDHTGGQAIHNDRPGNGEHFRAYPQDEALCYCTDRTNEFFVNFVVGFRNCS